LASRPESNPVPSAAPSPPQVAAIPPAGRTPATIEPLRTTGLETPLATIQFAHGSANLDGNDREVLRQAAVLALQQGAAVKVVGHSSGRGQGDSVRRQLGNLEMSIGRANAVAGALIQFGLDPKSVIVEAKADQEPLYRETAATGEAGNRRAEVYLIR
jgi:flagellar motor protein MotB